jgi:hypothetical protein
VAVNRLNPPLAFAELLILSHCAPPCCVAARSRQPLSGNGELHQKEGQHRLLWQRDGSHPRRHSAHASRRRTSRRFSPGGRRGRGGVRSQGGNDYTATQHRRDAPTGHGSRVLALTPAHLRKPAAPYGITANMLLPVAESTPVVATENSVAHYRHYFRREDLYRLVWTSPVSEIAVHLGVSDVALANLCRRAAI